MSCLAGLLAMGLLSRAVQTGCVIFDKYHGDALYAAMVAMTTLELFQLTMIPARLMAKKYLALRVLARLTGTEFSLLDLLAYAAEIECVYWVDSGRDATAD